MSPPPRISGGHVFLLVHFMVSLNGLRERETTCSLIHCCCCQGPSQFFLASVGGWSCDGVTVSGDLLTRLLDKGKQDSEVKDTFVEMVWM